MENKLLIFNLKMNALDVKSWSKAKKLKSDLVVCPAFMDIEKAKRELSKNIKIGAQNVFWANDGAYTGEVSPEMLKKAGVEYVIIGHSERRKYLSEIDEMINKKVRAAFEAGLKVILCVGEWKKSAQTKNFVKNQLAKDLKGIENWKLKIENLAIAYEPVWAIGTGKNATPEYALEMIKFIKEILSSKFQVSGFKILYGGSVDGKNVADFVKCREVDGILVGGASLKSKEVSEIIKKVG